MTPESQLLYAACCGDTQRVRELLEQGVPVDSRDGRGRTSLMLAVRNDCVDTVALLLAAGADATARNKGQLQVIDWVSNASIACMVLDCMPEAQRVQAATRLLFRSRVPEVWKCALAAGAQVNARNKRADTPLLQHCFYDADPERIRLLLEAGADASTRNRGGHTTVSLLARHNNVESLRLLIAAGADADEVDDDGCTPLHHAVLWGSVELAAELLAMGLDVNQSDSMGRTPIMHARGDDAAMIQRLLQAGADVNLADKDGWTPLHSCAVYNLPDLVPMLLAAGANPQLRDNLGQTPAEMAEARGNPAVVRALQLSGK